MATDYTTYDDLVQHLAMRYGLALTDRSLAHAQVAVREAYRRLFAMHDWNYFRRFELIHLNAQETTGTVVYTHSTRVLTLTGSTWPASVKYGDVKIAGVRYLIESRVSDTVVILPENFNPGANVASTTYTWTQHRYPTSFEVGDITEIMDPTNSFPMVQIDVRSAMFLTENFTSQTFPSTYTIFPSQTDPGCWEIWFPSAVYADREVKIMYDARHNPLRTMHVKGIGMSTVSDVATLPTGVLTASHVGCVLRVSTDDKDPTSMIGRMDDGSQEWSSHPFYQEHIITSITGDTATLNGTISDVSDRGWSISQLIDVDAGAMTTFMLRLCESEYTKVADVDSKSTNIADHHAMKALVEAQMDDSRKLKPGAGFLGSYPSRVYHLGTVTYL